jgi:hypothetical protein
VRSKKAKTNQATRFLTTVSQSSSKAERSLLLPTLMNLGRRYKNFEDAAEHRWQLAERYRVLHAQKAAERQQLALDRAEQTEQ